MDKRKNFLSFIISPPKGNQTRDLFQFWRAHLFNIVAIGVALLGSSCSTSSPDVRTQPYEPRELADVGLPYFQLNAITRSQPESGVQLSLALSLETMVFVRNGPSFESTSDITCRVTHENGVRPVIDIDWADTLRTSDYSKTRSRGTRSIDRFLSLEPGEYVIDVSLTDRNSGKSLARTRRVSVYGSGSETSGTGEIQVEYRDRGGKTYQPAGPYVAAIDSPINCLVNVHNLRSGDTVAAAVTVSRVERDTTVARLPFLLGHVRGSLEFSGVQVEQQRMVFEDTIRIIFPEVSAIAWQFTPPDQGLYLIGVRGFVVNGQSLSLFGESERPLIIAPEGFPRPEQLDDLLGTLNYLLLESESDSVKNLTTTDERQEWLQAFWRSTGKNDEAVTRNVERFYDRVTDANEYFSSFKEGWKTDRGMLYIVLGPPVSIQQDLHGEQWNYSTIEGDERQTYRFQRINLPDRFSIFDHFLLERRAYYDQAWFTGVQRWRRGSDF